MGGAATQVAVGLILMYVVLSLICSGLSEGLAGFLRLRQKLLELYLQRCLGSSELVQRLYQHPLLWAVSPVRASLSRRHRGAGAVAKPARIPPGLLSYVVMDALVPIGPGEDPQVRMTRLVESPETPPSLWALLGISGNDPGRFHGLLAELFEYGQTLVDAEYRRRVRMYLLLSAALLAVALNIDTVAISRTLWAEATAPAGTPVLPFGWVSGQLGSAHDVVIKVIGLLLTIGALSFGAEFWIGLLNRVAGVGDKAGPKRDKDKKDD